MSRLYLHTNFIVAKEIVDQESKCGNKDLAYTYYDHYHDPKLWKIQLCPQLVNYGIHVSYPDLAQVESSILSKKLDPILDKTKVWTASVSVGYVQVDVMGLSDKVLLHEVSY